MLPWLRVGASILFVLAVTAVNVAFDGPSDRLATVVLAGRVLSAALS